MTTLRSTLACFVALACLTASLPALAAPPEQAREEAKNLYDEGKIAFDTGDYDEAIRLWKRAYGLVPNDEESRTIRNALVYNLSEAHIRSYRVTGKVESLRTAKVLLEDYVRQHEQLYGTSPEAQEERTAALERLGDVDAMLKGSQGGGGGKSKGGTSSGSTLAPPSPRTIEEIRADPALTREWERGQREVTAGIVLVSVGGAMMIGGGIAAVVTGRNADVDDPNYTPSFSAGGVGALGFILAVAGAITWPVGAQRKKSLLEGKVPGSASIHPQFNRHGAGAGLTVRF